MKQKRKDFLSSPSSVSFKSTWGDEEGYSSLDLSNGEDPMRCPRRGKRTNPTLMTLGLRFWSLKEGYTTTRKVVICPHIYVQY